MIAAFALTQQIARIHVTETNAPYPPSGGEQYSPADGCTRGVLNI